MTDGVQGSLSFLTATSRTNRRYVSPTGRLNFCEYEDHEVFVRNARALTSPPTLESHGFLLAERPTALRDARNRDEVQRIYVPEAERLVKDITGADEVLTIAWMFRSAAASRGDAAPPSNDVHVDYTAELSEWLAETQLEKFGLRTSSFRRFVTINHWRPFTSAPQDWPLALCEGTSVDASEGVAYGILHVDALPDPNDVPEILPEDPNRPRSLDFAAFRFREEHRWYYFPDMSPNEVVLFKNSDSVRSGAWRVPHGSFKDPNCPETIPRESIEVRTLACFR